MAPTPSSLGTRLQVWWQAVTGSLWFVPAIMIAGSVLLALLLVELSTVVDRAALRAHPRIFGAGADSARSMLSTIAGAMMTVAGVTFSITVVAVTQASSQYTPRILRNFMGDRPTQLALGTLTGVFVYCLVVLRTVRGDEEIRFIPALAVLGAFALAVVAIGMLVYFIHHITGALQASGILDRIRRETTAAVDSLFPEGLGEEAEAPSAAAAEALARVPGDATWETVPARHTGYVTHVDTDGLLAYAGEANTVVRMVRGVGEYVVAGTPLCAILGRPPRDADVAALAKLFAVANYRTVEQDPAFGMRQMVDVAVKALSPGVNDTTTAVHCVDSLGAVLVHLAARRVENRLRIADGELRVIARGPTFESLLRTAIDEIRRNAEGNVSVLARMLSMLELIAGCTRNERRRAILLEQAALVHATSERTVPERVDRAEVTAAYHRVERALAARATHGSTAPAVAAPVATPPP